MSESDKLEAKGGWAYRLALFLFCLLAFCIPIEHKYDKLFRYASLKLVPPSLHLPPYFDPKIYFYPSDCAALILFALALFALRIPLRCLFFERGAPLLWAIFLFAFLSILASPLAHYPTAYIRLLQLFTALLLFSTLQQLAAKEPRLAQWFLALLTAAALFQSTIAIAQYFKQEPLGLRLLGEQPHLTGIIPGKMRWFFDFFYGYTTPTGLLYRASGTFSSPNALGGFLALSLLASYALISEVKKRGTLLLLILSFPIQFFALNLTFSRSALFGWALGSIVWFSMARWRKTAQRKGFLALLIAISTLGSFSLLSEQIFLRGGVVNYNDFSRNSDKSRIEYQNTALELLLEKPLFGIGYQQYSFAAEKRASPIAPHNIYLLLAVETGLFSLFAFLAFLWILFQGVFKAPLTPFQISLFSILLCLLFIGLCDFYPLLFQQGRLLLFSTLGLLSASVLQSRKPVLAVEG